MTITLIKRQMVHFAHQMYRRGYTVATDGNISARISPNRLLITRRGSNKEDLAEKDLIACDMSGPGAEAMKVSSEIKMHLAAYRTRHDIGAIIHAHPPNVLALNLAGYGLDDDLLPESLMALGRIPTARFAPPGSAEGADAVRELVAEHDAIILDRHGSLTLGRSLTEAWHNLERLELVARIVLLSYAIGKPRRLSPDELTQIADARKHYTDATRITGEA